MHPATIDNLMWALACAGEATLTIVLVRRGRWRHYPAFTALIAWPALASLPLLLFHHYAPRFYAPAYWTSAGVNFVLQLAVLLEISRVVLRPTGTWVQDAKKQFLLGALGGVTLALLLAYLVAPPAPTLLEALELRANLFTSLLVCELVIVISSSSNRLGLGWQSHIMAIGQGLTIWATVAVLVDSLHSYFGASHFYAVVEYLKSLTYLGALGYWCVRLWHEEPARQPLSPELRNYIVELHRRVQYDLGEAEQ